MSEVLFKQPWPFAIDRIHQRVLPIMVRPVARANTAVTVINQIRWYSSKPLGIRVSKPFRIHIHQPAHYKDLWIAVMALTKKSMDAVYIKIIKLHLLARKLLRVP